MMFSCSRYGEGDLWLMRILMVQFWRHRLGCTRPYTGLAINKDSAGTQDKDRQTYSTLVSGTHPAQDMERPRALGLVTNMLMLCWC